MCNSRLHSKAFQRVNKLFGIVFQLSGNIFFIFLWLRFKEAERRHKVIIPYQRKLLACCDMFFYIINSYHYFFFFLPFRFFGSFFRLLFVFYFRIVYIDLFREVPNISAYEIHIKRQRIFLFFFHIFFFIFTFLILRHFCKYYFICNFLFNFFLNRCNFYICILRWRSFFLFLRLYKFGAIYRALP